MKINGWHYYNYAALPSALPHEEPDMTAVEDGSVWNLTGGPLLARWTTDFDCQEQTNYWYVIKDEPFDISALKAKRRYEITKGKKNFEIKRIDPMEHLKQICQIQNAAYAEYPAKYRITVDEENVARQVADWGHRRTYGAYDVQTGELSGYALITQHGDKYIGFDQMSVYPAAEKKGINAALVNGLLEANEEFFQNGGYFCDGARNVLHETAFQDYLERIFGFRKAYCRLHVAYKPAVRMAVKVLYPFRKLLKAFDGIGIVHKINGVLLMEYYARGEDGV